MNLHVKGRLLTLSQLAYVFHFHVKNFLTIGWGLTKL